MYFQPEIEYCLLVIPYFNLVENTVSTVLHSLVLIATGWDIAYQLCNSHCFKIYVKYGVRSQKFIWVPCTAVLIGWGPATPALPSHLDSKGRRHLFVTLWFKISILRPSGIGGTADATLCNKVQNKTRSRIHERSISLRFLGIILRVFRLWGQFQNTFAHRGGVGRKIR